MAWLGLRIRARVNFGTECPKIPKSCQVTRSDVKGTTSAVLRVQTSFLMELYCMTANSTDCRPGAQWRWQSYRLFQCLLAHQHTGNVRDHQLVPGSHEARMYIYKSCQLGLTRCKSETASSRYGWSDHQRN